MRARPGRRRGTRSAKRSTRTRTARARTGRATTRKAAKAPAKKKAARKAAAPRGKRSAAKKTKAAKKTAKRTPRPRRKEVLGEGGYAASREFGNEQTNFVRRNRSKIESTGEEPEAALEGDKEELTEAEKAARARSHSSSDER